MDRMNLFEQIIKRFPLLMPRNTQLTSFSGFIESNDKSIIIKFKVPKFPLIRNLKIYTQTSIQIKLSKYNSEICEFIKKDNCTFYDFLIYFQNILNTITKDEYPNPLNYSAKLMNYEQYYQIHNELTKIDQDDFVEINVKQNIVKFIIKDESNRHLELDQILDVDYPNNSNFIAKDLTNEELEFIKKGNSLAAAYQNFLFCVHARQIIWASLEEIDSHCWIVFPQDSNESKLFIINMMFHTIEKKMIFFQEERRKIDYSIKIQVLLRRFPILEDCLQVKR